MDGQSVQESRMKFDWTVNFGHLLIMGGLIASGVSIYITIAVKMSNYDLRMTSVEKSMMSNDTQNAQIIQQLSTLQRDVAVVKDRLERPK